MKNLYKIDRRKGTERLTTCDKALDKCTCKLQIVLNRRRGA